MERIEVDSKQLHVNGCWYIHVYMTKPVKACMHIRLSQPFQCHLLYLPTFLSQRCELINILGVHAFIITQPDHMRSPRKISIACRFHSTGCILPNMSSSSVLFSFKITEFRRKVHVLSFYMMDFIFLALV